MPAEVRVSLCPYCDHVVVLSSAVRRGLDAVMICLRCGFRYSDPGSPFNRRRWEAERSPHLLAACWHALKGEPSPRKARLLFTAVARIGFQWCKNLRFNEAVAAAEEWADTEEPPLNLNDLRNRLRRRSVRSRSAESDWRQIGMGAISPHPRVTLAHFTPAVQSVFADAYRELLPNPFVMIDWKPEWVTSTVRDLARSISEGRRFDVMPILADALQDAGCEHQMILGHCRGGGPHARGCWVLDGLLGGG